MAEKNLHKATKKMEKAIARPGCEGRGH